jgi:ABC-type amino acid transport substrate-binding protein
MHSRAVLFIFIFILNRESAQKVPGISWNMPGILGNIAFLRKYLFIFYEKVLTVLLGSAMVALFQRGKVFLPGPTVSRLRGREQILKAKRKIAMKKIVTSLLALAMTLSLAACGSAASTAAPAASAAASPSAAASAAASAAKSTAASFTTVEAGKLHMSTNAQFPPYEMVKDDGTFEGIDVEIAGKIAEKLGLELVVDDMDFDAALQAAQNGKSDIVMAGVTVTDERKQVMSFSDTYANGVQVIIVPEKSDIKTVDDLAKADKIGTQRGTTGYIYCSSSVEDGGYGEDHVTAYDDGATAVQALLNGQVDAVVIDSAPAKEYVKANPGLKILDTEYTNEDYAIGVAKDNTALLDAINGALSELKADGTVQSIIDKYIPAA